MKIIFLDVETTGTSPFKHAIHQISGKIVIDGEEKEKFDFKVRPNANAIIDPIALQTSHVTEEEIMQYPFMEDVYIKFTTMLSKYVDKFNKKDKFLLAGYNCQSFDTEHLRQFFIKNGDKYYGSYFHPNTLDVMTLATYYLQDVVNEMPNFKQGTVAKYLDIEVDDTKLHNALYDIDICEAIYNKVTSEYNKFKVEPVTIF